MRNRGGSVLGFVAMLGAMTLGVLVAQPSTGFAAAPAASVAVVTAAPVPTPTLTPTRAAASPADRELRWARRHLRSRAYSSGHAYIPEHDCANFASRALVARGVPRSVLDVSSTALRRKVLTLGATELRDSQAARRRVRVGDLVQFDWWPSRAVPGDRDHTGIVSSVETDASGRVTVRYIAHTDGGDHPGVDLTIAASMLRPRHDPHGAVYFLLLP